MSKYLRPIFTGLVTGLLVAFALSLLYGPGSTVPIYYGVGAGLIGAYLAANLAGNRRRPAASRELKTAAIDLPPPSRKARLYIYREGFVASLAGLNVSVDGQLVTQLKSPQFTAVVLAPGRHVLTAAFGGLAAPQNRAAQLIIEAPADEDLAVLMAVKMGLLRNSVEMKWRADVATVKQALAGMAMVLPDVAEV